MKWNSDTVGSLLQCRSPRRKKTGPSRYGECRRAMVAGISLHLRRTVAGSTTRKCSFMRAPGQGVYQGCLEIPASVNRFPFRNVRRRISEQSSISPQVPRSATLIQIVPQGSWRYREHPENPCIYTESPARGIKTMTCLLGRWIWQDSPINLVRDDVVLPRPCVSLLLRQSQSFSTMPGIIVSSDRRKTAS